MLKHHNQILVTVTTALDLVIVYLAWELAYWLRFYGIDLPTAIEIPHHTPYFKAAGVVVVLAGIIFTLSGVYRPHRITRFLSEMLDLGKASLGLLLIVLAIAFFYRKFSYSRVHILYFAACLTILLPCLRLTLKGVVRLLHSQGIHILHILVVGTSETALNFINALGQHPASGMVLKGVVSISPLAANPLLQQAQIPYLGTIEKLVHLIM